MRLDVEVLGCARSRAHTQLDRDIVFGGKPGALLDALDAASAEPYCDFAFRRARWPSTGLTPRASPCA